MNDPWRNSEHLDDRELTALSDGELLESETARVRAHLDRCPQCRQRSDQLQSALREFANYCDDVTSQFGPPPTRLRRPARQESNCEWALPRVPARALASTFMAVCLLNGLFSDRMLPAARAMEVLRRARVQESYRLAGLTDPVLYQRLSVTGDGRAAEWEIWRTVGGAEGARRWTGDRKLESEILDAYAANGWDENAPLSPQAFLAWFSRSDIGNAGFEREDQRVLVRARRRDPGRSAGVVEASIALDLDELRPLEQWLRLESPDGVHEVRIREVTYTAVRYAAAPFGIGASHELRRPRPARSPAPSAPPVPTREELEMAEAQVRWKLHQMRADVDLTPEIELGGHEVVVKILADSAERRDAIRSLLAGEPNLRLEVWTADDAPAGVFVDANAQSGPERALYRSSAPLGDDLVRCLGSLSSATQFIDAAHDRLRAAMVYAIALQRLGERYRAPVPDSAQQTVTRIASDYLTELEKETQALKTTLETGLGRCEGIRHRGHSSSTAQLPRTWMEAGALYARQLRRLDAAFNYLFTTQETTEQPPQLEEALDRVADFAGVMEALENGLVLLASPSHEAGTWAAK